MSSTSASFSSARSASADDATAVRKDRAGVLRDVDAAPRQVIRRRPTPFQGRALEKLGHAMEYLVDSRMALIGEPATKADAEAVDILMRLSRCVFSECEEIVPIGRRLKAWLAGGASKRAH